MKILFLNVYYENFLRDHYRRHKIEHLEYMEQWDSIQSTMFGDSDFYSHNMVKFLWMAHDLITNCWQLQNMWAKENNYEGDHPIWVEQIRHYKPDVVYSQAPWLINDETYPLIKDYCKLIVGFVGTTVENFTTDKYDLFFTCIPPYVEKFKEVGIDAYYLPLAFDSRIWDAVKNEPKIYGISFVGQITGNHKKRKKVIDAVSEVCDLKVHVGEKWGIDMFRILARSLITLNCHIDRDQHNVGNMRMFEATGCGACLVTDFGVNIRELFDHDEVVVYDSPEGAAAAVEHYLQFPELARMIAKSGQARTLKDHTYEKRMQFVNDVLRSKL